MCDRLLFLAPGGQTAYFGPPAETLEFFEQPGYPEVFQLLDRAAPGAPREAFAGTEIEQRYVAEPLTAQRGRLELATARPQGRTRSPHAIRQLLTLIRRYTALISADRRNTLLLFAQAPILGLLMLGAFGTDNLKPGTVGAAQNATTVLLSLILAASYLGASNAIREIVKERPILVRERSVGLSAGAYVLSKTLVLGLITVVESFVLTYIALLRQGGPKHGVVIHDGRIEIALVVALTGLTAMALGLLVSALAGNADKVLTILPVILFAQFVLSGSAFPVRGTPGLDEVSYLSGARWGYSAAASTANLDGLLGDGCNGATLTAPMPDGGMGMVNCDPAHAATLSAWSRDMGLLGALTAVCLVGATMSVRRVGQPTKRRR